MGQLSKIEGIGPTYAAKLEAAGISSQAKLLEAGGTRKGRKQLAERCGISEKLVLGWVNRADLARVKGIGEEYADLLEVAGVDTVPALAQRNPTNLQSRMAAVNVDRKLTRKTPTESEVAEWVQQAKLLPRAVHY